MVVHEPKTKVDLTKAVESHRFTFDAFFNEADGNKRIYQATLSPLLEHVFSGGHATVFAFGQTGSGKTCTMAGHGNLQSADENGAGLYKLAAHDLTSQASHCGVDLGVSFFEVYRGQVIVTRLPHPTLQLLSRSRPRPQTSARALQPHPRCSTCSAAARGSRC